MDYNPMEQRFTGGHGVLQRAVAPFFYSHGSPMAHIIHKMKYRGVQGLGSLLGSLAARELMPCGWFDGIDLIAPVPLHPLKQMIRGYNQSLEICCGVASETGLPLLNCLYMPRWQGSQARRRRQERWKSRHGAYSLRPDAIPQLRGRHLLVVDDVCTTGATLQAVVDALSRCRDVRVSLFAVAIATGAGQ